MTSITEITILSEKPFKICNDQYIKNIIIDSIFKHLYMEAINKYNVFPPPLKLCYLLSIDDLNNAVDILNNTNNNLILVKKLYISKKLIWIYKHNNKYFNINMNMDTYKVDSIIEEKII